MSGYRDIFEAIDGDDINAVEIFLARGTDVNRRDSGGGTPLHRAAHGGNQEIVRLLLARGADTGSRDHKGGTPLHMAAYGGNADVANVLLAGGADVNSLDEKGWTPFEVASQYGHRHMAELLRQRGAKKTGGQPGDRKVPDKKDARSKGKSSEARSEAASQGYRQYVSQGDKLLAQSKLDEAIEAYGNALQLKPCDFTAQRNLINAIVAKGEYERAIGEYLTWAGACRESGDLDSALKVYREVISIEMVGPRKSFHVKFKTRPPEEILEALEAKRHEVFYKMGVILNEMGSFNEAIQSLRTSLVAAPFDANVHMALGEALMSLGMDKEAVGEFQEVVRIAPTEAAPAYEKLGEIFLRGGRSHQVTIVWLRNAAELYLRNRQCEEAARAYSRIIDIEPADESALCSLIVLCRQMGLAERASHWTGQLIGAHEDSDRDDRLLPLLERVLELDRDNMEAREKIIGLYRDIASSEPLNLSVRKKLINQLIRMEAIDEAIPEINSLVRGYLEKGMLEEALSEAVRLIELKPRDMKARQLLGQIYFDLGKKKESLEQLTYLVNLLRENGQESKALELERRISEKFS